MFKLRPQTIYGYLRHVGVLLLAGFLATPGFASLLSERATLLDLYEATEGTAWRDAAHWHSQNASVCTWEGVTCNSGSNAVVGLNLANRNLIGKLPNIFAGLPNLKQLDLRDNQLSGNIPASIGAIGPLTTLELQRNLMVGNPETVIQPILAQGGSVDVRYNGFYGSDSLAAQQGSFNNRFPSSQTLDAEITQVSDIGKFSAVVTWIPVSFSPPGGYLIEFTAVDGSIVSKDVPGKQNNQFRVASLDLNQTYSAVVRSYTNPHDENTNRVVSDGKQFAAFTIKTGDQNQAVAGDSDDNGSVITSRGGGSLGAGFLLFLATARLRRVRRLQSYSLLILLTVFAFPSFAHQNTTYDSGGNIITTQDDRFYGGFSGGITKLKPKIESGVALQNKDGTEIGGKLVLGYEISHSLSIEGFLGSLGKAKFQPEGTIKYSNYGIGLSLNGVRKIGTFSPFGRFGVNKISNSSSEVSYRRDEEYPLFLTAGLEYPLESDLIIRAEFDYFAADARMFSIGLIKRFGSRHSHPMILVAQPEPVPVTVVPEVYDSDADGIDDDLDQCPNSPYDSNVDARGCAIFQGYLQGVNFETNSSRLTPRAREILNEVATELLKFPNIQVEVQAHTDNEGDARYNQWLSERRAWSVVHFLGTRGVSTEQLRPVGYGEFSPITTNNTIQGKRTNRRVEFEIRQQ